ncbi:MAG: sulfatase-like hydrolase/transferase [Gemmatimonadaceae bacterium]|nr:sulfatase-like hydrolase/transferase [Gemmatimonadaceae bacterium]
MVVFMIARVWMFAAIIEGPEVRERLAEVVRMFNYGLRYDIRVGAIMLAPLTIAGLILLAWPRAARSYAARLPLVIATLVTAAALAAIANYFYYVTFGTYFDVFVYGLVEDDTRAVLSTIVADYPVVWVTLAIVVAAIVTTKATRFVSRRLLAAPWRRRPHWQEALIVVLCLAAYSLGIHARVSAVPLERKDAQVSSVKALNMLTPNALMALQWAREDHQRESEFPRASDSEGRALLAAFDAVPAGGSAVSVDAFTARTPANAYLAANPPHVVLALMESLGTHLLAQDDSAANDVLGRWRPYWRRDFTFTRFVSEGNSTMESLVRLLVSSPASYITQTRQQRVRYVSNIILPYKERGYRTVFITSGNGSWRNLGVFLLAQGFDEVIDQNEVMRRYPEAGSTTWGTFDDYSLRYARERLEEADRRNEHVFMVFLSMTNHPPYVVPAPYQAGPVSLDDATRRRLSALSYAPEQVVRTMQYANDAVGGFLEGIERGGPGAHTIVAVTGDHNVRGVAYPEAEEAVLAKAVPFFVHVPAPYRAHLALQYDPRRVGSHKDIMPTLYALSLSDARYFHRGVNLLSRDAPLSPWYFGFNDALAISDAGAFIAAGGEFRPWADTTGLRLGAAVTSSDSLTAQRMRFENFRALTWWQMNRQVNGQP